MGQGSHHWLVDHTVMSRAESRSAEDSGEAGSCGPVAIRSISLGLLSLSAKVLLPSFDLFIVL